MDSHTVHCPAQSKTTLVANATCMPHKNGDNVDNIGCSANDFFNCLLNHVLVKRCPPQSKTTLVANATCVPIEELASKLAEGKRHFGDI